MPLSKKDYVLLNVSEDAFLEIVRLLDEQKNNETETISERS